jgi:hypothetical protein
MEGEERVEKNKICHVLLNINYGYIGFVLYSIFVNVKNFHIKIFKFVGWGEKEGVEVEMAETMYAHMNK